jgi:hypothetical protein
VVMSSKQNVLAEIRRGIPPEDLAEKMPWESLSSSDLAELLKACHQMSSDQHSYQLLVYLFRISSRSDLWFSVEVLAQAIRHPIMTPKDRQSILWTMRGRLDRIRDEITATPPSDENLRKYWLMEASYYVVNSATLAETGHQVEAEQNKQIAQGIFEQLGLAQPAAQLKTSLPLAPQPLPAPPAPRPAQLPATPAIAPAAQSVAAPVQATPSLIPQGGSFPNVTPPSIQPPVEPEQTDPMVETQSEQTAPLAETRSAQSLAAPAEPPQTAPLETQPDPSPAALPVDALNKSQDHPVETSDIYQPLPDVWLKEGQLYLRGMGADQTADNLDQVEQIQRQSEILAGIQLQIQMYLERRSRLDREVKALEARAASLKTLCARMEKKIKKNAAP